MNARRRATVIAALSLTLAACGGGTPEGPAAPAATSPSPETHPLEGTWRSSEVTVEDLWAAGEALGLSRSQTEAVFWGPASTSLPRTFQIAIEDGQWVQTELDPDGTEAFGWGGTYEIVDDTTVVATDPCGAITYEYAVDGDALTIDMVDDECGGESGSREGELLAQTLIYESSPFTRTS
jgi:hypothetical protein